MSHYEGCSPYGLAVAILISFFVGREDSPEPVQARWRSEDMEGLQLPLPLAPSPLHYRILSSVIAQQLQAVDRAEEKTLGQLQDEIREALPPDDYALSVVDRLTRRLRFVRSLDDLVDLVHHLNQLLKPHEDHGFAVHGRERPMYLRPNSVFGVFLRRIRTAFDGASFSKISLLYEDVARYTAESINISEDDAADEFLMDLESPRSPRSAASQISFGLVGSSSVTAGTGGDGHIEAFLRSQSLEAAGAASPNPSQLLGERKDLDDGVEGVLAERDTGAYFPRSITSWQLQRRLQDQVIRLENGLSSQVSFEEIEREIQDCAMNRAPVRNMIRPFRRFNERVQAALGAHSDVPKAHFLRLMNCMHHRDLQGSLDSLHRYFDYAVRRGGPSVSTAESFLEVVKGTEAGSGQHKPQHASLALARLHFEFGHLEFASVALGEAIRVAQQGGDKACVAHAMSWLHQVLAAQGHPRASDVLRRCAAQAADLGLHDLAHSTALLLACEAAEAKNGSPSSSFPTLTAPTAFARGGVVACASPTRVWECLAAAASGDVKGLLESEAGGVAPEGGGGRAVMDKAGGTGGEVAGARACQRLLVEAGAFERYGYTEMAVTCARSVLQVHGEFATGADIELASAHVMSAILQGKRIPGLLPPSVAEESTLSGGGGAEQDVLPPEPATPGSAGKLPRWKSSMSEGGSKCVFQAALSVALKQHAAYPHPVSNVWTGGVMRLLHEWMVNRGELVAAEGLGMTLRGCCPLSRGAEAFIEAHLQRVRLLRAQGRWAEAVRAASALARLSDARGLAPQYARLLLELSRARLEAEPASPVGALPHALRCLAVCESFSLDALHASAMTHLAEVHLRMGSTQRARILMRACLGQLLVNAPVQSQGEAWLAMAKCEIAEASLSPERVPGSTGKGDNEAPGGSGERPAGGKDHAEVGGRVVCLRRAVVHLDSAVKLLKRCHHFSGLRECWYLKARVLEEFVRDGGGEFAKLERNAAAEAFLSVSKAGVRALAVASPGLKIGPAEIERYMAKAMATVPWESS